VSLDIVNFLPHTSPSRLLGSACLWLLARSLARVAAAESAKWTSSAPHAAGGSEKFGMGIRKISPRQAAQAHAHATKTPTK
jgi:hypothetical protein